MSDLRIVSLVPSATETVFQLGLGDALVGRSHVCNFPPEVLDRPILTRPELVTLDSREIHDEVRGRLSAGLAIFDLDVDGLRALEPTHLLVQDQCSMCAVSPADLDTALGKWLDPKPTLVRLAPHQLADVWADFESIGAALGRSDAAARLCESSSHRLSDLAETTGMLRGAGARPRVACLEWLDPLMIAGHWVPELIRLAGGEPLLATTGGASGVVDLVELEAAQPDVIVVQPCGFDLPATRAEWASHPALGQTFDSWRNAGGKSVRVALTDGDAYFNRPGPRLVESTEVLAEIVHAPALPSVYEGVGWIASQGF